MGDTEPRGEGFDPDHDGVRDGNLVQGGMYAMKPTATVVASAIVNNVVQTC